MDEKEVYLKLGVTLGMLRSAEIDMQKHYPCDIVRKLHFLADSSQSGREVVLCGISHHVYQKHRPAQKAQYNKGSESSVAFAIESHVVKSQWTIVVGIVQISFSTIKINHS